MKRVSGIALGIAVLAASGLPPRAGAAPVSGQDEVDGVALDQARQYGCATRAHRMLRALADDDYDAAVTMFSETSRRVVTADRLQQIWASLRHQYGSHPRLGRGLTAASGKSGYYLAGVPMEYAQATLRANVMCDRANAIVDFKITRVADSNTAHP